MDEVVLSDGMDGLRWNLNDKNKFVGKDLYIFLKSSTLMGYTGIWKLKLPHKTKIFIRMVLKNSIFTKENLVRRGWYGNEECYFCGNRDCG